jgi:hypothetical protein
VAGVLKRARQLLGDQAETGSVPAKRAVNPYHAVSIAPGAQACAAARGLQKKRFLSREAPVLPLKTCDEARCECRYTHHDDRRKGPRRASEMGVSIDGHSGHDQRLGPKRGRRKPDT